MVVSSRGRGFFEKVVTPIVKAFAYAGFSPNMLTVGGLAFMVTTLPFFMLTRLDKIFFLAASFFLMLGGLLDGLDGLLARHIGKQSSIGAFVDSIADRVSDSLVVVGFMLTGLVDGFLGVGMLATSMLVSYARARAEALNVSLKDVGFGERAVRLLILIIGTLAAYFIPLALFYAAVTVTALATVTVIQRVWTTLSTLARSG